MTGPNEESGNNPFVGPESLGAEQTIFGRSQEIDDLYYLLSSERIVLLHSPSGAGKSSLIRAKNGLISRLGERFDVRGPTRVSSEPPVGWVGNRYVRSANLGFEEGLPKERQRPAEGIAGMTLAEYVASRPRRLSMPENVVLIFDQFEESLTVDPVGSEAKREFFRQLGELLQNPGIWALFAIREEYLAQFDPYAPLVPTHLRSRFRLDLLSRKAAARAMVGIAREGGRTFPTCSVKRLVKDLATVQAQRADGVVGTRLGPHVEPLHLQVVCLELWKNSPTLEVTETAGDVTTALGDYYAGVVDKMPDPRSVREWVGERLITKSGIRGQVLLGVESSEGLPNHVIKRLEAAHLVRREERPGSVWFELAHDRLVGPVRKSNKGFFAKLAAVQKAAAEWEERERPPSLLALGDELMAAQRWAAAQILPLTAVEVAYLLASEEAQEASDKAVRQARRVRLLAIVATVVSIVAMVAGGVAWNEYGKARQQYLLSTWQGAARQAISDLASHADDDRSALLAVQALRLYPRTSGEPGGLVEEALQSALAQGVVGHILLGNTKSVNSIALDARGNRLASAGGDGAVRMWDLRQHGVDPVKLAGQKGEAYSVVFSPDGSKVAAAGEDKTVRVWEVGKPAAAAKELQGNGEKVWSVAFSRDGKWVASGGGDSAVLVWDLVNPTVPPIRLLGAQETVKSVAFLADGEGLATGGEEGLLLWDLLRPTAQPRRYYPGPVQSVAVSGDGKRMAAAGPGGRVLVWELERAGAPPLQLAGHEGAVRSVAFSQDGKRLASAGEDRTVRIWDLDQPLQRPLGLMGHQGGLVAVALSATGDQIASAGEEQGVRVWEVGLASSGPGVFSQHQGERVHSVAFAADGNRLFSTSGGQGVLEWNRQQLTAKLQKLPGEAGELLGLASSSVGNRLAGAGVDNLVYVWEVGLGAASPPKTFGGHSGGVRAVALSKDGMRVASGAGDGEVRLWEVAGGEPVKRSGGGRVVNGVAFSPDGRFLASASSERKVMLWDLRQTPVQGRELAGLKGEVLSVAIGAGNRLAGASADSSVLLWDLSRPEAGPQELRGHAGGVNSVEFSADGQRLASGGADKTVRVWDLQQLGRSVELRGHREGVRAVSFSPDGLRLASASEDGTVRVWTLWGAAAEQLCGRVWRNLSREEWRVYIGDGVAYERTCPALP